MTPHHPRERLAALATLLLVAAAACGDDAPATTDTIDATATTDAPDTTGATDAATNDGDASPPPPGRVVINEVECRSDPVEWVELKNVGGTAVDVTGYRVADAADDEGVRIAEGVLQPGSYMIVRGDIGLSCERDQVFLVGGGKVVDVAPVRRGDPELAAWGRFPDGSGEFTEVAPTPQKQNRAIEDERATLFVGAGTMPTIDLFVDAAAEATLVNDHRAWAPVLWSWTDDRGTSPPQRIEIRIKGAITDRPWNQKPSLKVHFARNADPGPKSFRGVKKLALHSMVYDPSTIREWLAYEVMRRLGVPAPRVGWAVVRVNGESKGLYGVIEPYDEIFLRDYYPGTVALYEADGDLQPGGGGIFLDEGDSMEHVERLAERVAAVLESGGQGTQVLPEIDWRELAALFGAEDLLQHTDGMKAGCHNYYLHVDPAARWTFMAWSVDLVLIPQFGGSGPIGSCNQLSRLCDEDERCVSWFERARDQAAQLVLREDLRTPAVARAARNQGYADRRQEPWTNNDFWPDAHFDLARHATDAVDLLELRARAIRCTTAAEQGEADPEDPTCGGFNGPGPGGGPKVGEE